MKFNIHILTACCTGLLFASCHKDATISISQPVITPSKPITTDTLSGSIQGTMLAGRTYYFEKDITINQGDTVTMESGVKLIALGDGSQQKSPQITVNGSFISLGTKSAPNYITVAEPQRSTDNAFKGIWGGIQCTPVKDDAAGGDLILKWTHIEYAGGPSAVKNGVYGAGDPRYLIYFANMDKNFILEDCWITGSKDDAIRVDGGKISILRNTFELCGEKGGEAFNIKSGTVGDVAYNVVTGAATNGFKVANTGSKTIQTNVNVYNNTMINCGFRQTKENRGGGVNYEALAKGKVFNNLFINCRISLRIVSTADLENITYGHNLYYGNAPTLLNQFNATDGQTAFQATDIHGGIKQNNPLFYGYDVDQFDYTTLGGTVKAPAVTWKQQPLPLLIQGTSNFRIKSASPATGKGFTNFAPLNTTTATGDLAASVMKPGADLGAYQTDGSGNQH
ncbi:hypothetical protein [Chitinophaga nivalis]|uniref:Right handed beta helix domain-containing protein n=1 Tax=Chitinophaga nivalis TaxID=2991709 RepID=A0ABT3IG32_9BACT|nr:hypothetical protein [Chitinophaga nivalis]MCW3467437.1 hypothetical protein [Chitinophaga nivalis]MCW3482871.1 hypothetical protein [Chitinophaga nivalis]